MKNATLIDFVIPYVNNQDKVWQNTFINYCTKNKCPERVTELYSKRFSGITFIYDQIKLVNKNMPWVNKIYLLLSNIEQIDKSLLPSNVEIVLHNQFIPSAFLPTFNSTTIEMFLWNIPNLSENFIYANDDMLPIGKMKPSDFFSKGKVKIEWLSSIFFPNSTMFGYQCKNNCESICKAFGYEFNNVLLRPIHSFTPMIKSHCVEAYKALRQYIEPHIRGFRTQYQHNQYIYPLYELMAYGTLESNIDFLYTELRQMFDFNHQIICVNAEKNKEVIEYFKKEVAKLCE